LRSAGSNPYSGTLTVSFSDIRNTLIPLIAVSADAGVAKVAAHVTAKAIKEFFTVILLQTNGLLAWISTARLRANIRKT
jgi:hypothetical protein